jgi:hypothetical protein
MDEFLEVERLRTENANLKQMLREAKAMIQEAVELEDTYRQKELAWQAQEAELRTQLATAPPEPDAEFLRPLPPPPEDWVNERERLTNDRALVVSERDAYRRAVYAAVPNPFPYSTINWAELDVDGPLLADVLRAEGIVPTDVLGPFQVRLASELVRRQLSWLFVQATARGCGPETLAAVQTVAAQMARTPLAGDPLYLLAGTWSAYRALYPPLQVAYAVDAEARLVLLRAFQALPFHPLAREA